jgi:hypothetical protein
MENIEQKKIIKLLQFLTNEAVFELEKNGIIIKNFQYSTNIKIEGLPDWSYKVEFSVKNDKNPFKKLNENKGEVFVLPYEIMKIFIYNLTEEINNQQNKEIIDTQGKTFFNKKKDEILNILNSDIKIEEDFRNYILCYKSSLFNNTIIIDKPVDDNTILNHEFIKLNYTYLISENLETDTNILYKTQNIKLIIPVIEVENYKILSKCFSKPIKKDYTSLIDILKKTNQDDKMNKLLLYTNLEVNLESKKVKYKPKKI